MHVDGARHSKKQTLPALTGARFFAAASVVVFHFGLGPLAAAAPALAVPAAAGPAAVSFFYVLSGAVLTWGSTGVEGTPTRPARIFWAQRAARILPAYLLALAVSFLPFASHVFALHTSGALPRIALGFGAALLLVQAFLPPLAGGLNTPGWSVSCEAFFYAVWPRSVARLRVCRPGLPWWRVALFGAGALLAPLGAIAALRLGLVPRGPYATLLEDTGGPELLVRFVAYFPPFRLCEFLLGVSLGHALRATPQRTRSFLGDTLRELGLVLLLVAVATWLGTGHLGRCLGLPLANRLATESGMLAPLFAVIVWQLARGRGALERALSTPALLALGEASYALYVLQEPTLVWMTALIKRVAPRFMAYPNVMFWVYAALLVLISLVVQRYFEAPLRKRLLATFSPLRIPA